ncbi:thiol:disulfide interchange protein DsbG [Ramlibacter sp.]|uniref:thiol:disulfide interchange protein DsbG n=1 Tax=Ramlibacter sp. TaxID=1917967 RepID=UPI002B6CCE50|nr:thiol:disulfide interchange protein DsbG [Ramlibacter sp.]HWI83718.1 thiol:disulfide interchange protein DsbG [Ramlibacter sp.]
MTISPFDSAGRQLPAPGRPAWAALALAACAAAASAQERPEALQALQSQGVTIVGTFPAPGGLTAWAGYAGQQPLAFYATPDGKHLILGTMLDAQGKDVTQAALEKAVRAPMTAGVWKELERSHWIGDGKADAPRVVYVFTDPNCPYCNKFWADARPWVDSGKVVLRHIMVGILTPTSAGKAAALLASKDPAAALSAYERGHVAENAKVLGAGRPKPLGDGSLKPLASIPPAIGAQLDANEKLMASLRLQATPAFAWRDATGAVQTRTGAPPAAMAQILGPR